MRSLAVISIALALVAPTADAGSSARFGLTSAGALSLDGDVGVQFPGGVYRARESGEPVSYEFKGANGRLNVVTWSEMQLANGGVARSAVKDDRTFTLRDGTLMIRTTGQFSAARVIAARDSFLWIDGSVQQAGRPTRLLHDYGTSAPIAPDPTARPALGWHWSAGWGFIGRYEETLASGVEKLAGFPAFAGASVAGSGHMDAQFDGGTAEFRDSSGVDHVVTLDPSDTTPLFAGAREGTTIVFSGAVTTARLPAAGDWGVAGPTWSWTIDGTASWSHAEGRIELPDRAIPVYESLSIVGSSTVVPQESSAVSAPVEGDAHYSALMIDGHQIVASNRDDSVARDASVWLLLGGLLAAALALAPRFGAALYTRIAPGRILEHQTRARIHTRVHETPGIHMRELHREVGGAWGPFQFHLRMLEQVGLLRIIRDGRYRTLLPAGVAATDVPLRIHHPIARAIVDALPADGSSLSQREIAERVGASHQLVSYHLKALRASGAVVDVAPADARERAIARATLLRP